MKCAIGVVGLGVMGANLARNIESRGYRVAGYDLDPEKTAAFAAGDDRNALAARSAEDLADSLERLDNLSAASTFFEIALRLAPEPALQSRVDALRAELARRAENARRRPAIQDELEQPYPVHPKLEAQP